jgi:hypothetical protein
MSHLLPCNREYTDKYPFKVKVTLRLVLYLPPDDKSTSSFWLPYIGVVPLTFLDLGLCLEYEFVFSVSSESFLCSPVPAPFFYLPCCLFRFIIIGQFERALNLTLDCKLARFGVDPNYVS